jgi:hypothetical protein
MTKIEFEHVLHTLMADTWDAGGISYQDMVDAMRACADEYDPERRGEATQ